jgi:hypothetical protein
VPPSKAGQSPLSARRTWLHRRYDGCDDAKERVFDATGLARNAILVAEDIIVRLIPEGALTAVDNVIRGQAR